MVSPITDQNLIRQLEAQSSGQPITDPDLINQLESSVSGQSSQPTGFFNGVANTTASTLPLGFQAATNILSKVFGNKNITNLPYAARGAQPSTLENVESGLTKGAIDYAPYGALGGEKLLGQIGAGGLYGATSTSPNEENLGGLLPSGKIGGSIESALLNALTGGTAKALEAIRPSNVLRGTLSPEQLQKNVDVTAGTETPLGDVIDSPRLKRVFENILPYVPFSGASQASQRVASDIKSQGKDLFSQIGVDKLGANSGAELQDALKKAAADARVQKEKNYSNVNKIADDSNLNVGRDNFSNKAQETLQEINQSPELKREVPGDLLSDIQSYADNKEGNTLKLSNIFKGKLGDKASDFYTNGKMYEYRLIKNLQDALGTDIDSSIKKSGNSVLKDKYAQAQKDYKEKFAPFEDPDIVKFTRQGGDSDLILSHFIKTGQNDRATLLNKVMTKLSGKSKSLPLQMYLSKSVDNGEVNPLTFKTLYDKLGDNQKKVLINDDKTRDMLENYSSLVKKNTSPLSIMANPKTGQQNLDVLTTGILGILGQGLTGNAGALAGTTGAITAGRLGTKALTSESIRNALVKKMIENKSLFTGGAKIPSYQTGTQALKNALGGGNNQ